MEFKYKKGLVDINTFVNGKTLYDFLKDDLGLPARECKTRISNSQITIDGEPMPIDFFKTSMIANGFDAGDFIFYNIEKFSDISFFNIIDIFTCDLSFVRKRFEGLALLKVSKKHLYIIQWQI